MRELAAQEPGGALQPFARLLRVGGRAERREPHLGMRLVARELHAGEGHHADARIAQLEADHLRELALDLVGDARLARARHGTPQAMVRATSTTSNTSR